MTDANIDDMTARELHLRRLRESGDIRALLTALDAATARAEKAEASLLDMTHRYHESSIEETKLQDKIDAMQHEFDTGQPSAFGSFYSNRAVSAEKKLAALRERLGELAAEWTRECTVHDPLEPWDWRGECAAQLGAALAAPR